MCIRTIYFKNIDKNVNFLSSLSLVHGMANKTLFHIYLVRFFFKEISNWCQNSFLNHSKERFVITTNVILKLLFFLMICPTFVKNAIGLLLEAIQGLQQFHSYCFCWVGNGNCKILIIIACCLKVLLLW